MDDGSVIVIAILRHHVHGVLRSNAGKDVRTLSIAMQKECFWNHNLACDNSLKILFPGNFLLQ